MLRERDTLRLQAGPDSCLDHVSDRQLLNEARPALLCGGPWNSQILVHELGERRRPDGKDPGPHQAGVVRLDQ